MPMKVSAAAQQAAARMYGKLTIKKLPKTLKGHAPLPIARAAQA
jgi:hypothetical protein